MDFPRESFDVNYKTFVIDGIHTFTAITLVISYWFSHSNLWHVFRVRKAFETKITKDCGTCEIPRQTMPKKIDNDSDNQLVTDV